MELEHFSHDHPLILRDEMKSDEKKKCTACEQPISGRPSYGCRKCKEFVIHKSCAELPQLILQHPFHPLHPLTLSAIKLRTKYCDACGKHCSGFVYRCAFCSFDLDVGCASLVPTLSYEGHDHLLTLFDTYYRQDKKCNNCDTHCRENVFRCVACDFNIHKSCVGFPKQIQQQTFHPLHIISLSPPKPISKSSGSLGETDREKEREMEIEHFSHAHPLILRDETTKDYEKCFVCKQPISGQPSYGCRDCSKELVIHKSCAELPQQILQHPFHPLHPLTLSPVKTPRTYLDLTYCNACGKRCSGFVYHCVTCHFDLDVGCASLVPTLSYEGHDHLLTLFDPYYRQDFKRDKICNNCDTECHENVFRCVACDFNIHKSCVEFPKYIHQHPFHPLCILSHTPKPYLGDHCDACGKSCSGPVYNCIDCMFNLHLECSKLVPTISYKHHKHLLTHFDNESDLERLCYCCGINDKTSFFRCVQCNLNVHKSCTKLPEEIRHPFHELHPLTFGNCLNPKRCDFCHRLGIRHPTLESKKAFVCVDCDFILQIPCFDSLPHTVDHKCHVCPMTLKDSVVEQDYCDDDSDDYYCDACETQRDPKRPVYFCTECEFVAHINCVIPREVLSLPTFKQKIKMTAEEAVNKLSSTLKDFTSNRASERGKFHIGDVANPAIAKLNEDIAKLWANIEAMVEKVKNLESKREALIAQVEAATNEIS